MKDRDIRTERQGEQEAAVFTLLHESDRERILNYISGEPEMNLFLFGDLENFGVESEEVNFYAALKEGKWDCLLLRYFDSYILYSGNDDYDAQAAADFLRGREIDCISGKTTLIRRLEPFFPQYTVHSTYMSRCNRIQSQFPQPPELKLRPLGEDDLDDALELLTQIDEFAQTYRGKKEKNRKQMQADLATGGIIMGGYVDGRLSAIATTSAANSASAMIVGVAARPDCRRRGYASAVTSRLCQESLKQGKQFLCLFYVNPEAGRIYHRIGFEEIGEYAMFR